MSSFYRITFFLFFGLFLFKNPVNAQNNIVQARFDSIRTLPNTPEKGRVYSRLFDNLLETNVDSAISLAKSYVEFSNVIKDSVHLVGSRYSLASGYMMKGSTDSALTYFLETEKHFHSGLLPANKGSIIGNIGILFYQNNRLADAVGYYEDARGYFEEAGDTKRVAMVSSAIGSVFFQLDSLHTALDYYNNALSIKRALPDSSTMSTDLFNIGLVYENLGNFDSALVYLNEAKTLNELRNLEVRSDGVYRSLASINARLGNKELAHAQAQKSLELSHQYGSHYDLRSAYENLADVYKNTGDMEKAYQYLTLFKSLSDSLVNIENNQLLTNARERYLSEKREQEIALLEQENANQELKTLLIGSSLGLILLLVVVVGFFSFNRKRKEVELRRKENILAESQQKLTAEQLQNEQIKNEHVHKELTNYALHLVEKNEFLDHVKDKISEIKLGSENVEVKKELTSLELKIYQNVTIQEEREEFERKVEHVSEGFYQALRNKYNDLTQKEQRLAALLRLNLSSKDIASILNITVKSVEQSRYRLRKRLGVSKEQNLTAFLDAL